MGELYAYLPPTETNLERLRAVPGSHESSDYGFSIGRGMWNFQPGHWTSLAIRVRLNDFRIQNGTQTFFVRHLVCRIQSSDLLGEIEVFVEGRSVLLVDRVAICEESTARIRAAHFQTFFGG